jgi:hypothetical protein
MIDFRDEDSPSHPRMDQSCYMWWDSFIWSGDPPSPEHITFSRACLSVLEQILSLPSLSCQESVLHGLGHMAKHYPELAQPIIDAFLESDSKMAPRLRRYAEIARTGKVL